MLFAVYFRTLDTESLVMQSELIHTSPMVHSSTAFIQAQYLILAMQ